MMSLNGAQKAVDQLTTFQANPRKLPGRLQYFNDMNFVYGDGRRDKYQLSDGARLDSNADEYFDNLSPGELCYMTDLVAYVQKDDEVERC